MRNLGIIVIFLAVMFSQGCCTIFTGDSLYIEINSNPQGAKVKVGPYMGVTPYSVQMPNGKDYVITAEYNGKTETLPLNRSIETLYWVNILFWPGLIVDFATGNMYEYNPMQYNFDFRSEQLSDSPAVAILTNN